MPFYFRKSVSFGPLRVNFSKSGVGLSAGVRGLRFGTGPRGHYVRAGLGGIYYQQGLGKKRRPQARAMVPARSSSGAAQGRLDAPEPLPITTTRDADMREIDSRDVVSMRGEAYEALLGDIQKRARRWRMAIVLPVLVLAVVAVAYLGGQRGVVAAAALALPAWLIGIWVDASRRVSILAYELEPQMEEGYRALCEAFDALVECEGIWHVSAQGTPRDINARKRNAMATGLVVRNAARPSYALPKVIKSNLTPPMLRAGKQLLYFLPDVILVEEGRRFGAVGYDAVRPIVTQDNFIETDPVPRDAEVVGSTWLYANKKGGPDRRFANNRELPICKYEQVLFSSDSGLNEKFEFSRRGPAAYFSRVITALAERRRQGEN